MSYLVTWQSEIATIKKSCRTPSAALAHAQGFLHGEFYTPEDADSDDEKIDAWIAFLKIVLGSSGELYMNELSERLNDLLKDGPVEFSCDSGTLTIEEVPS